MKSRHLVLVLAAVLVLPFESRIAAWDTSRDDMARRWRPNSRSFGWSESTRRNGQKSRASPRGTRETIVTETYLDAIDARPLHAWPSPIRRSHAFGPSKNPLTRYVGSTPVSAITVRFNRPASWSAFDSKSAEIVLLEEKLGAANADGKS